MIMLGLQAGLTLGLAVMMFMEYLLLRRHVGRWAWLLWGAGVINLLACAYNLVALASQPAR